MPDVSHRARGFTLIEAVIAVALVTAILTGVAQLMAVAAAANARSRAMTLATIAAGEWIERLLALPFDDGALVPSPGDTLSRDVDGYSDVLPNGDARRWSIEPLPSYTGTAIVVRVVVSNPAGNQGRSGNEVRLMAIKTRLGR